MNRSYAIVPTSPLHIKPMAARMRVAGALAVQPFGIAPRAGLHRIFIASSYCRTAVVDRKPIAMWGVAAPLIGDTAIVWLVLAQETGLLPYAIVREARAELQRVAEVYPQIRMTVLPDDEASVRFAFHLGFRPTDGEHWGSEHDALSDPRFRIPLGDCYVVQMGYAPLTVH